MRTIIAITAVLLVPGLAAASIESHTSASSQTGGNVVGPGGTVKTGDASASVTTSSSASGSSSSSYYIKTDINGQVHEEHHTSNTGDVSVSVQATPTETIVETREGASGAVKRTVVPAAPASAQVSAEAASPATTTATITAVATTSAAQEGDMGLGARIVLSIQSFFVGLLSWFT